MDSNVIKPSITVRDWVLRTPVMDEYEGIPLDEIPHADYPHEPGRLYDCPRCEAECFCTGRPEDTECVFCASLSLA